MVSQWIAAHMASTSLVALFDQRLPFLFPPVRHGLLHSSKPSICSTLFKAFDALLDPSAIAMALKATFGQLYLVSLHLSLILPLSAASTVDPRPVMIGYDRVNSLMRWISSGAVSLVPFSALHCLPSASRSPLNGANDCFDSLLKSLLIEFIDIQTQMVSSKPFHRVRRSRILRSFSSYSVVRTCPASFWRSFWGQPVPLVARNPWYRLLHRKLPCAALVHKIVPDLCSSFYRLCDQPTIAEDPGHFFVSCPRQISSVNTDMGSLFWLRN
ncbi:hypothetical protein G6F43_002838 [Rhizopus delemar]|nr:hypothetical protein G6F43_002838 [Rhizopus delemar]